MSVENHPYTTEQGMNLVKSNSAPQLRIDRTVVYSLTLDAYAPISSSVASAAYKQSSNSAQ